MPERGDDNGGRGAGDVAAVDIMGTPLATADRGTAELLSQSGGVGRSRPERSLDAVTVVSGVTSTNFSGSLSFSSPRLWLFHTHPRPMEVTPQLLPTLAARYSRGLEEGGGSQSSSLSKLRSTIGAASIMPCKGGRVLARSRCSERDGVDDGGAERERNDGL